MNIFITVGTSPYPELIKFCDDLLGDTKHNVQAQVSEVSGFIPGNLKYFEFVEDITQFYNWADVVISHAGAGSFYQLMELRKKVILVPNNKMKDNHQNDICKFAVDNNYAFVLNKFDKLYTYLELIENYTFNSYRKEESEIAKTIIKEICN